MKLALSITTPEVMVPPPVALLSGTFPERLEKAQRLGYDGVELMVARPAELDARELQALLKAFQLEVAAVASGPIFMQDQISLLATSAAVAEQAAARLASLIELAANLKAPVVTLGSFRGRLAWAGGPDALPALTERLLTAAEQAARCGVRLALEPLNRYETDILRNAAEGLEFLAKTPHAHLGLLLDTFHMNIEEADISATLFRVNTAGKLFHIHLGDSNRLPPGLGHFNFARLVRVLKALNYQGYLSAELFPLPDADSAGRLTVAHMSQLVREV